MIGFLQSKSSCYCGYNVQTTLCTGRRNSVKKSNNYPWSRLWHRLQFVNIHYQDKDQINKKK